MAYNLLMCAAMALWAFAGMDLNPWVPSTASSETGDDVSKATGAESEASQEVEPPARSSVEMTQMRREREEVRPQIASGALPRATTADARRRVPCCAAADAPPLTPPTGRTGACTHKRRGTSTP